MSHRLKDEVFTLDLPRNQIVVLMAYADFANDDGSQVFPSKERMAWMTGYCEKTVRTIRDELKSRGILRQVAPARWVLTSDGKRYQRPPELIIDLCAAPRKPDFKREPKTAKSAKRVVTVTTQKDESDNERVVIPSKEGGNYESERVVISSKMGGNDDYHLSGQRPSHKEPAKKEPARARESRDIDIGIDKSKPSDPDSEAGKRGETGFRRGVDDIPHTADTISNLEVQRARADQKKKLEEQKRVLEFLEQEEQGKRRLEAGQVGVDADPRRVAAPAGKYDAFK